MSIFNIFQNLTTLFQHVKPRPTVNPQTQFVELMTSIHASNLSVMDEKTKELLSTNRQWIDTDIANGQRLWMAAIYQSNLSFLKFLKEECHSPLKSDNVTAFDLGVAIGLRTTEKEEQWDVLKYLFSQEVFGEDVPNPFHKLNSVELSNAQWVSALALLHKINDVFIGIKSHTPLRAVVEDSIGVVESRIQRNTIQAIVDDITDVQPIKKRRM